MTDEYRTLRHNINMLGRFLGETINDAQGEDILTLIENVRQLSKQSRAGDSQARKTLLDTLSTISNENIIPVAHKMPQKKRFIKLLKTYSLSLY